MNIAVYGGSFNPIHMGHLWIAQQITETYPFDEIWFLASKDGKECNKTLLPVHRRLHMIDLAINEFGNDKFKTHESPDIFTFDSMNIIQQNNKHDNFTIVLGSDRNITTFKDYKEYGHKYNTLQIRRPRWEDYDDDHEIDFGITMDISSTDIRTRIYEKKTIKGLIPEVVRTYIQENKLYVSML